MDNILRVNVKILLFCLDIPLYNRFQIMEDIRDADFLFFYLNNTAFNTAHVQNIIDQT